MRNESHHVPSPIVILAALCLLAVGMLMTFGIATYCSYHVRKHGFTAVMAASISADRCLSVTIATTARLVLSAEACGLLVTAFINGTLWLVARGALEAPVSASDAGFIVASIAPYFGIGSVIAAIALQQTGSACIGALKLTGAAAFEARTGLASHDPRNPSVLVEAVAIQLGAVSPKILDSLIGGVLLATVGFQLAWATTIVEWARDAWAIATLPLLIRAFGLIASLFGLFTLRMTEHEDMRRPLWRGQAVAYSILASAVVGLSLWLVGSLAALTLLVSGTALLLTAALGHVRTLLNARSQRSQPEESTAVAATSVAERLAADLKIALVAPFAYVLSLLVLMAWLRNADLTDAQLACAVLLGLSLPSSLSAWNIAVTTSFDVNQLGSLSAAIGRVDVAEAAAYRLKRIRDGAARVTLGIAPSIPESSACLCALAAIVCMGEHMRTTALSPPILGLVGMMVWVGLPGVFATAATFGTGAKTARTQANEIDRQLRGMRRDGSRVLVPEDFVPSYRSCVELLARDSVQGNLLFVTAALALPAVLARLTASPENIAGSTAVSLAFYASLAAAVGLFASTIGYGASVVSNSAGRTGVSARPPGSATGNAATETQRLVDFLRLSLGVSAPLLTKAVALATLAFSAMLL
jgi:K(+)-stimulated pyrophosphate-energized sodium pump